MEATAVNRRENIDPNSKASVKKSKKANNVLLTPKIKKAKRNCNNNSNGASSEQAVAMGSRTRLPRACNGKGHVCNGQCITPLPTRLCSMSGRRRKRVMPPIPSELEDASTQQQLQEEQ